MKSDTCCEKIKIKKSRTLLGLSPNKKYSTHELTKKYRIAALKNHPDKNYNSDESTAKFKEINEAYLYLYGKYSKNVNESPHDDDDYENEKQGKQGKQDKPCYSNLFSSFINSLMGKFSKPQVETLRIILQVLMNKCATLSVSLFDQMDRESLLFIYNLTMKYHTILDIGEDRLETIVRIMKIKLQENDIIIIHPSISDLFDKNNIQVVEHEKQIYYVPLWHTELYYHIMQSHDKSSQEENREQQRELVVKCIPKLPEYIYVDEANNIYIDVRTRVENLFNQQKIMISVTESVSFDIPVETLEFKTHQTVTLKKCGIPMINTENMYDVSEKMDVIIHLEILFS
jgi:curved DNA-binding protein CbpA